MFPNAELSLDEMKTLFSEKIEGWKIKQPQILHSQKIHSMEFARKHLPVCFI